MHAYLVVLASPLQTLITSHKDTLAHSGPGWEVMVPELASTTKTLTSQVVSCILLMLHLIAVSLMAVRV